MLSYDEANDANPSELFDGDQGLLRLPSEAGHCVQRQEEEHLGGGVRGGRGHCGAQRAPPAGPVAERRAAAGDAHGVDPAGAELLVPRGRHETRPRGRARLPIVDAWKHKTGP